jgi:ankyrin repeat protein/Mg2+ and Co2+ transporter CorA
MSDMPSEQMATTLDRIRNADAGDVGHLSYLDLAEIHPTTQFGDTTTHIRDSDVSSSDASTDDQAKWTWTPRISSGGLSRGIVDTVDGLETLIPRAITLFGVHRQSLRQHFTSSLTVALYLPDGDKQRMHTHSGAGLRAAAGKVCLQLITLVAFGLREDLSSMSKSSLEILTAEGWKFRYWICGAIAIACSRNDEHMLQCLLSVYPPRIQATSSDDGGNIIYDLANYGMMIWYHEETYAPGILAILRRYFSDNCGVEDFLGADVWTASPLHLALKNSDTAFSHMFLITVPPLFTQRVINLTDGAGDTVLHLACKLRSSAGTGVVRLLCEQGANMQARSKDHRTPLHLAAESQNRKTVRYMLSKSKDRRDVHPQDMFGLTPLMLVEDRDEIMEFLRRHGGPKLYGDYSASYRSWSKKITRTETTSVYELLESSRGERRRFQTISTDKEIHSLTWFHFPANNIGWCEAFLTKWFVSNAEPDIEGLKAARRAFDLQHTTRTWRDRYLLPGVQISYPIHSTQDMHGETHKQRKPETDRQPPKNQQMFIAVPFMHFESMASLEKMKKSLQAASTNRRASLSNATKDEKLYKAYADDSDFHPRRTLDQYFHPSMNTDARDCDQVVQRYQLKSRNVESDTGSMEQEHLNRGTERCKDINTIMVDQLWIWVLSDKMLMTNFPQRWNKPASDPSDFYQSFSSRWTDHYHPRPDTASEVALLLMVHCFGTFDRHAQMDSDLQFMSMFEQSIGTIGADESRLLKDFANAYKKLKQKSVSMQASAEQVSDSLQFVEILSDLTHETDLLSELKDIRDELNMMRTIIDEQKRVSQTLLGHQLRLARSGLPPLFKPSMSTFAEVGGPEDAFEELNTVIDQGLHDIGRLDEQAARLGQSLTELLQLKQAHLNAFELEFSRKLSLDAAKQSRAVLVFTIVTIVFSPLSFVAAFFTMPLVNLPKDKMSLTYVSKYVFTLGFAVALPCIALALYVNEMRSWWTRASQSLRNFFAAEKKSDASEGVGGNSTLHTEPVKGKCEPEEEPHRHTKHSAGTLFSSFRNPSDSKRPDVDTKPRRRWRDNRRSRLSDGSVLPR